MPALARMNDALSLADVHCSEYNFKDEIKDQ
jgi:hypothetical protein